MGNDHYRSVVNLGTSARQKSSQNCYCHVIDIVANLILLALFSHELYKIIFGYTQNCNITKSKNLCICIHTFIYV